MAQAGRALLLLRLQQFPPAQERQVRALRHARAAEGHHRLGLRAECTRAYSHTGRDVACYAGQLIKDVLLVGSAGAFGVGDYA